MVDVMSYYLRIRLEGGSFSPSVLLSLYRLVSFPSPFPQICGLRSAAEICFRNSYVSASAHKVLLCSVLFIFLARFFFAVSFGND